MADDFIKQVRANHPFPWSQAIFPNGIVVLLDATGKEVPLFTITEFTVFLTNVMNKPQEKAA